MAAMQQNMMNAAMQQQMMNSVAIQGAATAAQAEGMQQRNRINNQGKNCQEQAWGNMQRNGGANTNSFQFDQAFTPTNFTNNFNKQGSGQVRPPPNSLRIFENTNYCWTHNHHIEEITQTRHAQFRTQDI